MRRSTNLPRISFGAHEPDEAGLAAGSGGTDGQGRESNDRVAVWNRQGWREGRHHPSSARVQPGLDAFNPGSWCDFRSLVEDGFKGFVTSTKPEEALGHLNDFRVLCALRSGAYGADRINDYILKALAGSAAHPSCPVPLMIAKNDRSLGVANGDVGVLMPDKPHELFLPVEDGSCRMVRVELLDSTEVAFATTIHKSQGSEFNDVAIVLPPADKDFAEREWQAAALEEALRRIRPDVRPEHYAAFVASAVEGQDTETVLRLYNLSRDNLYQIRKRITVKLQEAVSAVLAEMESPDGR